MSTLPKKFFVHLWTSTHKMQIEDLKNYVHKMEVQFSKDITDLSDRWDTLTKDASQEEIEYLEGNISDEYHFLESY